MAIGSIKAVEIALPKYEFHRSDLAKVSSQWLGAGSERAELFERFLSSSQTDRRFFSLPLTQVLSLGGLRERSIYFEQCGSALGVSAVQKSLLHAGLDTSAIHTLVFTSCTSPVIPSIDALILERAGLNRTTNRIPIYQHGCAAGVVGLGLAGRLAKSGETVLLSSVELCSLVFPGPAPTKAELVGSALFADGAACAVITPDTHGLLIRAHESFLLPDTRHLMGYDLRDDGFHLLLDRELPKALKEVTGERVSQFLSQMNISAAKIKYWLFHPGGVKILNLLESAFNLRPEQSCWSRRVLKNYGNLSSATVLFVLYEFFNDKVIQDGELAIMVGVGPGLTLELLLLEYRS